MRRCRTCKVELVYDSNAVVYCLPCRFWRKVARFGPDDCWLWQAGVQKDGYGKFLRAVGDSMLAHRMAWILVHGETELDVLHTCDVRRCCNLNHLYEGTALDNARDREARERGDPPTGEEHYSTYLSWTNVAEIRRRVTAGEAQVSLVREFNATPSVISDIIARKTWKGAL